MKKIIFLVSASTALLLSVNLKAHAQIDGTVAAIKTEKRTGTLTTADMVASASSARTSKVTARAMKNFQKSFKNIPDANWFVTIEGGMVASFKEDQVRNDVYYGNDGRLLYSIKRFSEKELPKEVRSQIKSSYYDFNIICAEEIDVESRLIYLVHIQFDNESKTIRVENGEMEVIQDLKN